MNKQDDATYNVVGAVYCPKCGKLMYYGKDIYGRDRYICSDANCEKHNFGVKP